MFYKFSEIKLAIDEERYNDAQRMIDTTRAFHFHAVDLDFEEFPTLKELEELEDDITERAFDLDGFQCSGQCGICGSYNRCGNC